MTKVLKPYLVMYAKVESSNFSGTAPDVLGCISSGDTLEEMRAMMLEALTCHFEFMAEDGEHAPEPRATTVEFPADEFDGVEYFIVERLEVPVPTQVDSSKHIERRRAQAA